MDSISCKHLTKGVQAMKKLTGNQKTIVRAQMEKFQKSNRVGYNGIAYNNGSSLVFFHKNDCRCDDCYPINTLPNRTATYRKTTGQMLRMLVDDLKHGYRPIGGKDGIIDLW